MDGNELRRRREALGLTLEEVAGLIGRTGPNRRQTVFQWERGDKPIPAADSARLLVAFRAEARRLSGLRRRLRSKLALLTSRQRDVIVLRYGVENGTMRSLEDVARVLKVTRQAVAEIEEYAIKRIGAPRTARSAAEPPAPAGRGHT